MAKDVSVALSLQIEMRAHTDFFPIRLAEKGAGLLK
jgi:hypothetical protein